MSSSRDRALTIIELLAQYVDGLPLFAIADRLAIPRSGTHRLLADLKDMGYVRIDTAGTYSLTVKLVALGLNYLSSAKFNNLVQPVLERLALRASDLVMLSIIEGDRLMRVAKVQGAKRGLQYNPVEEPELYLAGSANGQAWLSCLTDDAALQVLARQGIRAKGYGPDAPPTISDAMERVRMARRRGFGFARDSHEAGIAAIAQAIYAPEAKSPVGTLSIAGPSTRLTEARLPELASALAEAVAELSVVASGTAVFNISPQYSVSATAAGEAA
jgi:IclR family transcriptional regulator, acetate operon repressor